MNASFSSIDSDAFATGRSTASKALRGSSVTFGSAMSGVPRLLVRNRC